jgi:hypothetical protein
MKSPPKQVPTPSHKQVKVEELGNLSGRRTNGITTVGGGNQGLHMFNHYGTDAPKLLTDVVGMPSRQQW